MGLSKDAAMGFYHACESGKGWSGCAGFCHPGAGFPRRPERLQK